MNIANLFSHTKSCRVCGDTASGFNFGGLSCESCKAFFRRNVIKEKAFECKNKNHNCLVIKSTRNDCQKFRMAKCLTIGMKLQLINKITGKTSFSKIPKIISDLNQDLQPYDFRCIGKIMTAIDEQ